jgi:hypothetical protein
VEVTRASDGGTLKLSVDPGKHRLKVEKDGFALFVKEFSIASGESEWIRATLTPPQAVVSAASRPASAGPIPAPPGLIAWWSGDGHAEDYVGNHHGKPTSGVSYASGMVGQAFCMEGLGGRVCVPSSDALNPKGGFSIECWFQSTGVGSANIISKWNMDTQDFSYILQDNGWENPPVHYVMFGLTERSRMNTRFDLANLHGRRPMLRQNWTHVAATFDGSAARLYVNGTLDGESASIDGRIHAGSADILIGPMLSTAKGEETYRRLIDELCLYDRALAAEEIVAIYRARSAGKIKPASIAPMERSKGSPKDGADK